MDGFVDGTRISKYESMSLPSGHPAVIFETESRGVEKTVKLWAQKNYEEFGTRYCDWRITIEYLYSETYDEYSSFDEYKRESKGYLEVENYEEYTDEGILRDGLRREEEMREVFNNIVMDIKVGKNTSKIVGDYRLY